MNWMEKLNLKGRRKEMIFAYGQILLGCLIGGAAYPLFLTPNNIAPGGLTGVATILNYLFKWPVGMVSLAMNIPLFLVGFGTMGHVFFLRSLAATALFSFAIDLLQFQPLTTDPLLGCLFGGVMLGIGLGFIMRGGATTGGTDMIASIVHRHASFLSVGMLVFLMDFLVVVAACIIIGTGEGLYALISIYVSGKVIDVVLAGLTSNKACFIMTEKWEAVTERVLHDMDRGVTQLRARGGYSKQERPVVLCVLSRQEIQRLKEIVRSEDENAFMFITEAHEALGEGFSKLTEEK